MKRQFQRNDNSPKQSAPFTNIISKINNTQVDDAQYIDIVMPMFSLIEYSDAYLKASESLWKYYRDKPALDNNSNVINFPAKNNNSISFKFKQQITGQARSGERKYVEIMVPLKYPSNLRGQMKCL